MKLIEHNEYPTLLGHNKDACDYLTDSVQTFVDEYNRLIKLGLNTNIVKSYIRTYHNFSDGIGTTVFDKIKYDWYDLEWGYVHKNDFGKINIEFSFEINKYGEESLFRKLKFNISFYHNLDKNYCHRINYIYEKYPLHFSQQMLNSDIEFWRGRFKYLLQQQIARNIYTINLLMLGGCQLTFKDLQKQLKL